ncbi:MAG: 23S rRNA (adenine(2030)-N(6))-methyltransferase RlmJ [bacterium]|jgi:23S rRNA (adenine2030-N6)-methyltransferase
MPNPHFGNIGDIWKHLPLATILALERPGRYWESHSGSAKYTLSTSPERDYGIFHFLKNVNRSQALRTSAYNRTLEELEGMNGRVPTYPGSPLIAMMLLRNSARSFIFCDIDAASLASIAQCAAWVGVDEDSVRCIKGDGVEALQEELERAHKGEIIDTLVFIDPFDPFDGLDLGMSPMNLFCLATQAGARAALWYGFSSAKERTACWDDMLKTLRAYEIDSSSAVLWCGEICLKVMGDPGFTLNPGVMGCGLLTANLGEEITGACTALGNELSRIYERARFPSGHPGTFDFNTVSIW